jgi:transcriptional regulator with XRE-family HTH domain
MKAQKRGPGHRYPAQVKRRARRLFKQHNWTAARIARELAVPYDRVRAWVADIRKAKGTGNVRRYDRQAILDDSKTMTRAQLQARHGCSARFLSDLLNGKLDPTPQQEPKLDHP